MAQQPDETPERVLVDFMSDAYDCHTIILYGSRATGNARADSDWDVLCINDWDGPSWYHASMEGVGQVNAYIYPETDIASEHRNKIMNMPQYCFGFQHGKVLIEKDGLGQRIIAEAKRVVAQPPEDLVPSYRDNLVHFYSETVLDAMDNPDVSSLAKHLLHHEVIVKSLFNYFTLRGQLRPPAKDALRFLQTKRPEHYAAFARAAARGASVEDVAQWLKIVLAC